MSGAFESSFGFDPEEVTAVTGGFLDALSGIQDEVAQVVGRGSGADGHVTVAFSESAGVHELVIGVQAMRLGSERLAEAVTVAVEEARQDLRQKVAALITESMGDVSGLEETIDRVSTKAEEALTRSLRNATDFTDRF
ncbi:hypothetical protein [Nonomuraea typhae]|uniref:YbaB/EbfC family DNA-binding protein n=1 Tax=Nonomuraea typhae TaxID=2603600 RepID=A0ABW7Z007_9ACTN